LLGILFIDTNISLLQDVDTQDFLIHDNCDDLPFFPSNASGMGVMLM
jgi:hypothetical protein